MTNPPPRTLRVSSGPGPDLEGPSPIGLPTTAELERLFSQKYGSPDSLGWAPRRRHRFGYYTPADVYEALVGSIITDGCRWIDVGGGHNIFPENPQLARTLVRRCSVVVAVDPSANVHKNTFATERVQALIEDYQSDRQFDVATLRMVVEHVVNPGNVATALAKLTRPGGVVVVFTVNEAAPLTRLSRLVPFALHHPVKRLFWASEEEDTFPVQYKMNSRASLARVFGEAGFEEVLFAKLDDLATWSRFYSMNWVELASWRALRAIGLSYPETCLLGVYQRHT